MRYVKVEENFYYIMHPRPVAIVTVEHEGKVNMCAVAWFTPVSEEPPLVAVAIGKEAYTSELILKSREFAINLVTEDLTDLVWKVGTSSGRKVDKVKEFGVKLEKCNSISAPRLANAAAWVECRVKDVVDAGECYLFIASVEGVYARSDLIDERGRWRVNVPILLHAGGRVFVVPGKRVYPRC